MLNLRWIILLKLKPLTLAVLLISLETATAQAAIAPIKSNYVPKSQVSEATSKANQANRKNAPDREFCSGVWINPNYQGEATNAEFSDAAETTALADQAYLKPEDYAELSGNVSIRQQGQTILADQLRYDLTNGDITSDSDLSLSNGDFTTLSKQARLNADKKEATLGATEFYSVSQQSHGSALKIQRNADETVVMSGASYTTCDPDSPAWKIEADQIKLNPETGRGSARNAKLKIKDTPVFYSPYLSFPIDDRRLTGFLAPSVGVTNTSGIDLRAPVYLNLRPELDAIVTPRILTRRGAMLETELRYLTPGYGQSELIYNTLPSDALSDIKNRYFFKAQHEWEASNKFNLSGIYQKVSDRDYFSDLAYSPLAVDEVYLPRNIKARYNDYNMGLSSSLTAESYDIVDPTLPDASKPYERLPQLGVQLIKGNPVGFNSLSELDVGYFRKNVNDGSAVEDSGLRAWAKQSLSYNKARSWGYAKSTLSLSHLSNSFDDNALIAQNRDSGNRTVSVTVPGAELDAGLFLERFDASTGYTQTLEPRAQYAFRPYEEQSDLPNFNTIYATPTLDQLFDSTRLIGHDRIDDTNKLAYGVTYRLNEPSGRERLSLGVASAVYFDDVSVNLPGAPASVDPLQGVYLSSRFSPQKALTFTFDSALTDASDLNYLTTNLIYQPSPKVLSSVGFINRRGLEQIGQQEYKAFVLGGQIPFRDQWQFMSFAQISPDTNTVRDALAGLSYDSCCYQFSLYGRRYFSNLDNPLVDKARQQVLFELTFKGLTRSNQRLQSEINGRLSGIRRDFF